MPDSMLEITLESSWESTLESRAESALGPMDRVDDSRVKRGVNRCRVRGEITAATSFLDAMGTRMSRCVGEIRRVCWKRER